MLAVIAAVALITLTHRPVPQRRRLGSCRLPSRLLPWPPVLASCACLLCGLTGLHPQDAEPFLAGPPLRVPALLFQPLVK